MEILAFSKRVNQLKEKLQAAVINYTILVGSVSLVTLHLES